MARGLRRHPPHPIFHRPTQIQNGPQTFEFSFTANAVVKREQTASFTADAVIKTTRLFTQGYAAETLAASPAAYWRFGEPSGTNANNEVGSLDGTYVNTPTLGVAGALTGDADTAITVVLANSEAVTVPDDASLHFGNGPFTYELWLKRASLGIFAGLISNQTNSSAFLRLDDTDHLILTQSSVGSALADAGTISDTKWHHIVATWDNTSPNSKLYVDGVDRSATFTSRTLVDGAATWYIGAESGGGSQNFDGSLDEPALYASILSAGAVAHKYALGTFGVAGSGFTADAVLNVTVSGSFTANAVVKRTQTGSFTADAVIHQTIYSGFAPWTALTAAGAALNDVAFGNGYWVRVGNTGLLHYKAGGPVGAWTSNTQGSDTFNAVAYGNGYWVAVGNTGTLYYATDPTGAWTSNAQGSVTFRAVAYGNGYWVAVGDTGTLYYKATDPTSAWTSNAQGTTLLIGVAYGNGYWVAVANSGFNSRYKATDPTGAWSSNAQGPSSSTAVAYGNGLWVAVSGSASPRVAVGDPTGTWTLNPQSGITGTDVVYADGYWAIATSSTVAHSRFTDDPSGTWWNSLPGTGGLGYNDIAYNDGYWVLVGATSAAVAYTRTPSIPPFRADAVIVREVLKPRTNITASRIWRPRPRIAPQVGRKGQFEVAVVEQSGSFTADAIVKREQAGSFTADAIIRREASGSFTADACIAVLVWTDDFTRTVASGLGVASDGSPYYLTSGTPTSVSVDGSIGSFDGADYVRYEGLPFPRGGAQYAFDIRIPTGSGAFDLSLYYEVDGGPAGGAGIFSGDGVNASAYAYSVQSNAFAITNDIWYSVKAVNGSIKVWERDSGEPTGWSATTGSTFATFTDISYLDLKGEIDFDNFRIWAVGEVVWTRQFTANAVIKREQSGSFTADAVLKREQTGSLTADAVIKREATGSFTADAVVRVEQSGTLTADAIIAATVSGSLTADADISARVLTPKFNVNALGIWRPKKRIAPQTKRRSLPHTLTQPQFNRFKWDIYRIGWRPAKRGQVQKMRQGPWTSDVTFGSFTADAVIGILLLDDNFDRVSTGLGTSSDGRATYQLIPGTGTDQTVDGSVVVVSAGTDGPTYVGAPGGLIGGGVTSLLVAFDVRVDSTLGGEGFEIRIPVYLGGALDTFVQVINAHWVAAGEVWGAGHQNTGLTFTGVANGDWWSVKALVSNALAPQVSIKAWKRTDTEPADWQSTGNLSFATIERLPTRIVAWRTSGFTSAFDNLRLITFHSPWVVGHLFTADAVTLREATGSFTADASIATATSGQLTVDAVIFRADQTGAFTADAVVNREQTGSFAADAEIIGPTLGARRPAFRRLQRLLPAAQRKLHPTQFFVEQSGSLTADAILLRTQSASITADAIVRTPGIGSLTADAVVLATRTASFFADAVVLRTQSGSFAADAIVTTTTSASFTADASITTSGAGNFSADAVVLRSITGAFAADAVLRATIAGSLTADAVLQKTQSGSFTADAVVRASSSGSLSADAIVLATLTASFTADAVVFRSFTGSFTADAITLLTSSGSFSADAVIKRTITGSFTADAVVQKTITGSFTADAFIAVEGVFTFSADAVILAEQTGSLDADATIDWVARAYWTTPANIIVIPTTPTLAFTMPTSFGPMHFQLQLDQVDSFDGPNLQTHTSFSDLTGWEYWDGAVWQPVPQGGVPNSFSGNEARYTLQTPLSVGTWYRRVRTGSF